MNEKWKLWPIKCIYLDYIKRKWSERNIRMSFHTLHLHETIIFVSLTFAFTTSPAIRSDDGINSFSFIQFCVFSLRIHFYYETLHTTKRRKRNKLIKIAFGLCFAIFFCCLFLFIAFTIYPSYFYNLCSHVRPMHILWLKLMKIH